MHRDISPLVNAAEHQKHVVDCFDGCFPYALRRIWQDTKDQRADALRGVFKLGAEVLHHLNDDVFIGSFGVRVVQAWSIHQ